MESVRLNVEDVLDRPKWKRATTNHSGHLSIGPRKRDQGRRSESKALAFSKQTANCGRSVQNIYE